VAFVISDFLTTGYEHSLRLAARRHDLVPVVISDPLEEQLPRVGLMHLQDAETGEVSLVDTSDPRVQAEFTQKARTRRQERSALFARLELDSVALRAGEDHTRALTRFFRVRARRLAA
jgi:hypothetical protein